MRWRLALVLGLALAAALTGRDARAQPAPAVVTLRLGTLAPRSPAGQRGIAIWNRQLAERTGGTLQVRMWWGGSLGDERSMVRRMRIGQLDGASLTSGGLSGIVRQVLVMQVPGVFTRYEQVDRVRGEIGPELARAFEQEGFHLLGWGDAGRVRIFARRPITRPSDLRSTRAWVPSDDIIFSTMLEVVGATGRRLGVGEVFGGLRTGMVDTVPGTALAVGGLQWFTSLTHVTAQSDGFLVGGMIVRRPFLDGLTEAQRQALSDTAAESHDRVVRGMREGDERAYQALLTHGMTAVDSTPYRDEWTRTAAEARRRLAGRVFPAELLARVERLARESP